MKPLPYYLGAPLWSNSQWKGCLYSKDAKPGEFLEQYAQVFNAVEGSTTFYAVPSVENVDRWLRATPDTFRFSFKFPKTITHQNHLLHTGKETLDFLRRMQPLGERLNGLMVQLPASFTPLELSALETFLGNLPKDYQYAVEVRHPAFFTHASTREIYNKLLERFKVDRVIFETRPVHAAPPADEATRETQKRKPRLPVQLDLTAKRPLLRYIGHPVLEENHPWLDRWVAQTARWLQEGKQPRIFLHTPSNQLAPELARMFHQQLQERMPDLPELPVFLGEKAEAFL